MSLIVENLNVELQKEEILHEVSLDINDGEFISLLGASGCGKSTLLKSIAGLLDIESGHVLIDGKIVNDMPPENRGTVIVFQDLRLFPHMTVERNIAFAMELKKIPKGARRSAVEELLRDVKLSGYGKRKIKELSGGQLQRVALARALAANPKVLLLDEPFSGLDEKLRAEMGSLVKELHDEKKITTILVTHDKREALQMSDRIALMDQGEILQYDTPEHIFYHPVSKQVADYFGKANYIRGTVKDGRFTSDIFTAETTAENGEYEAMVRPFDIWPKVNQEGAFITEVVFMGELAEVKIQTEKVVVTSSMRSGELTQLGIVQGRKTGIGVNPAGAVYFRIEEEEKVEDETDNL